MFTNDKSIFVNKNIKVEEIYDDTENYDYYLEW